MAERDWPRTVFSYSLAVMASCVVMLLLKDQLGQLVYVPLFGIPLAGAIGLCALAVGTRRMRSERRDSEDLNERNGAARGDPNDAD